jgi:hypothetical protein
VRRIQEHPEVWGWAPDRWRKRAGDPLLHSQPPRRGGSIRTSSVHSTRRFMRCNCPNGFAHLTAVRRTCILVIGEQMLPNNGGPQDAASMHADDLPTACGTVSAFSFQRAVCRWLMLEMPPSASPLGGSRAADRTCQAQGFVQQKVRLSHRRKPVFRVGNSGDEVVRRVLLHRIAPVTRLLSVMGPRSASARSQGRLGGARLALSRREISICPTP